MIFKALHILKRYIRTKVYGEMGKRMTKIWNSFPVHISQPGKQMAKEGHN